MYFIGIDLAWSYRNTSAVVILIGDVNCTYAIAWAEAAGSDEEIVTFILNVVGNEPALVAIDAPLVVPNERGARKCDLELSRAFRRYEAGAHPANRRRFGSLVRGEELVRLLGKAGFLHTPNLMPLHETRQVLEVYPHPAAITLFGLDKTLKYKARTGRSYQSRWAEMRRYISLLRSLEKAKPSLIARDILNRDPLGLRGKALKRLEDLLDALFCAYIAYYCWYWGPEKYIIFGDLKNGYIVVPGQKAPYRPDDYKLALQSPCSPLLNPQNSS